MQNNLNDDLKTIQAHKLALLDSDQDFIYPFYEGNAISNLPDSIATWLGAPRSNGGILNNDLHNSLAGDFEHIILLVMDGLGLNWFNAFLQKDPLEYSGVASWQRILQEGTLHALTSVMPSTTAAALTSLWTGKAPQEHGIIGYEMWLKEYGMIANMIHHSPASYANDNGSLSSAGFDPETFLPVTPIGKHLSAKKIRPFAFQPASIMRSGLSQMILQGAKVYAYRTQSDLWISLQKHVEERRHLNTYTYVYCSELDTLAHRYGPNDDRLFLEFSTTSTMIERFINRVRKKSNGKVLFLMVADHGQIETPKDDRFHLENHPKFKDMLVMQPSGENRFSYIFPRSGCIADVKQYIQNTWEKDFTLLSQERILQSGLLGNGPEHPEITNRLGDLVLLPNRNNYLWSAAKENPLLGRHGGLSPDEMLVPFFATTI